MPAGLYLADRLVGSAKPEWLFTIAGLIAMPFAATAYLLIARVFAGAGARGRMVLAVSGWFVLLVVIVFLVRGSGWIFPQAAA